MERAPSAGTAGACAERGENPPREAEACAASPALGENPTRGAAGCAASPALGENPTRGAAGCAASSATGGNSPFGAAGCAGACGASPALDENPTLGIAGGAPRAYCAKPLKLAGREIRAKNGVFVVGILNCTPDSFYGASRVASLASEECAERALAMVEAGADVLDIGAESSRPGAAYISAEEELARLLPVLKAVRRATSCPISVDTRKLAVFSAAFGEGADILNDISALQDDAALAPFCAKAGCPVILMHKRGDSAEMMRNVCYNDVVDDIVRFFGARLERALAAGIGREKIILDPGVGFSKKFGENCAVIRSASRFSLGGKYPVLVGASRKACIGELTGRSAEGRLAGTLAAHLLAVQRGATWLRVHDVAETVDMIKTLRGIDIGRSVD